MNERDKTAKGKRSSLLKKRKKKKKVKKPMPPLNIFKLLSLISDTITLVFLKHHFSIRIWSDLVIQFQAWLSVFTQAQLMALPSNK